MLDESSVLVIIPAYNEAKNIAILIEKVFSLGIDLSILIIDDNSPDGTSAEIKRLQGKYINLKLITRKSKLGLGSAYIEGFKYALKEGYDVVIQMDADLSHNPSYIPKMVELVSTYDLIVGSRYAKGGGVSEWFIVRRFLSTAANLFVKFLLRLPINDLTSGFKCMKREVLENIDFITISSKGYAFQIEMILRVFLKGFRIYEYPIIFYGRKKEKSKMNLMIILEAFLKLPVLYLKRIGIR